jgi:hypothetical protein
VRGVQKLHTHLSHPTSGSSSPQNLSNTSQNDGLSLFLSFLLRSLNKTREKRGKKKRKKKEKKKKKKKKKGKEGKNAQVTAAQHDLRHHHTAGSASPGHDPQNTPSTARRQKKKEKKKVEKDMKAAPALLLHVFGMI